MQALTPQEKKQYLLQKYVKRDYSVTDLKPKYAVYFNPSIEKLDSWKLVCVCDDENQALKEILWRKKFHETNDGDLVLDHDKRFETFRDETKHVDENGRSYEPGQELMNLDYTSKGDMMSMIAKPTQDQNLTNFRGIGYYSQFELDYKGFYEIKKIFEI